jgi:hypothetical protein
MLGLHEGTRTSGLPGDQHTLTSNRSRWNILIIFTILKDLKIVFGGIGGIVDVYRANLLMMLGWMVFSKVIGFVELTFSPNDVKHALADTVPCPVESHIDCFRPFLFYGIIDDSCSGTIVCYKHGRRLWMPEFLECDSNWAGLFAIVKEATKFCFSCA